MKLDILKVPSPTILTVPTPACVEISGAEKIEDSLDLTFEVHRPSLSFGRRISSRRAKWMQAQLQRFTQGR